METTDTRIWDEYAASGRGDRMAQGHWPAVSQLLTQYDLKPNQTFLDVGCGNGYTVRWAAEKIRPQGQAFGVDLSPEMITLAQGKPHPANASFQVAEATQLPFADGCMDAVINIESLYYYPDMLQALQTFYRVLKSGGRLAVMVDFYRENPYSEIWSTLLPVPMDYLSEEEYRAMLVQAGFKQVHTQRLLNLEPVDVERFTPGWGYNTVEDVITFRQQIGSLALWGTKP